MRPSFVERERVATRLRGAYADERLSVDTLSHRLEIAYTARSQDELEWLVADLPEPRGLMRAALTAVPPSSPLGRPPHGAGRGAWSLRDLGSTNGTYVNGRRITGETEVRPGDEVALGAERPARLILKCGFP